MEIFLIVIFNSYFLIPVILTGILPLRWVLRFWIFISIFGFGLSAFQTQGSISDDKGIGYVLGTNFLIIYGFFLFTIAVIRTTIKKNHNKKITIHTNESKIINIIDILLSIAAGIVVSILTFKFISFYFESTQHGFLIHSGLSLILINLIWVSLRYAQRNKKHSHLKALIFIISLFCGLLLFSGLGAFYPYVVVQNAQNIAGENPYCIGLNKRSRPLNSLEDLTLLTMDKDNIDHHAFLLIEKNNSTLEPYHWSYLESKFLPGIIKSTNNNPPIPCHPSRNFIKKIPLISNSVAQDLEFYFHDVFLKIPKEYSPRISSNYISVAVEAPDFKPTEREEGLLYASMEITSRKWMEKLHEEYKNLPPTGKIGSLNEVKNTSSHIDRYYRFNENGQLATLIGCHSSSRTLETACQHRFYRNDAMYTFDHSKELLPQSEEMEKNLFDLFESFKKK